METITDYMNEIKRINKKFMISPIIIAEHEGLIRNEFQDFVSKHYADNTDELEKDFVDSLEDPLAIVQSLVSSNKSDYKQHFSFLLPTDLQLSKINFWGNQFIFFAYLTIFTIVHVALALAQYYVEHYSNPFVNGYINDPWFYNQESLIRWLGVSLFLLLLLTNFIINFRRSEDADSAKILSFNFILQIIFYCVFISFNWFILNVFDPSRIYNPDFSLHIYSGRISSLFFWIVTLTGLLLNIILIHRSKILSPVESITKQTWILIIFVINCFLWPTLFSIFAFAYGINPINFMLNLMYVLFTWYTLITIATLAILSPLLIGIYFFLRLIIKYEI